MAVPAQHCDGRVSVIQADARGLVGRSGRTLLERHPVGFTTVLSDMCPATTGAAGLDAVRSLALAQAAVEIALGEGACGEAEGEEGGEGPGDGGGGGGPLRGVLRERGALVVKLLEGEGGGRALLGRVCKRAFETVKWARPKATRPESKEVYLLALRRRGPPPVGVLADEQ